MSSKPVVVYGASGYTGRLVCEYLREYGVPFVAAGSQRGHASRTRWARTVPGIETADYDVTDVEHDVEALTELFTGAKVVLNTVGPFSKWGPTVVEAALAAGAHYTDTTGEQDWLITCEEQWGEAFADKGLLLAPGIAQMYTTGEIAAQICLEKPGLDTLDIAVFWGGSPTIASTQTILVNAATSAAHYLEQNQLVASTPLPASCPSSSRVSTSWPCRCPGAAPRTRSGSGATRAWPTSRRRVGSSTPLSCTACRRSSRPPSRQRRTCPRRTATPP